VTDNSNLEAEWRAEFERDGELLVYDNIKRRVFPNEAGKCRVGLRWLADEAIKQRRADFRTLQLSMQSPLLAVAAAVIGGLSITLALLYH
jgi:hypothetical protein